MTQLPPQAGPTAAGHGAPRDPAPRRGLRWWLRVIEVRLRFIMLVLVVLLIVTQWQRLRNTWDDWWHAWRGETPAAGVSGDTEYFCPMDPGVVSIWPAICPICNMDLVQRKKHDAQLLPEGVVARMQISPYRVQLAGIRTAEVAARELSYEIPVAGVLQADHPASEPATPGGRLYFEATISRRDSTLLSRPRVATVSAVHNRAMACDAVAEAVSPTATVDGGVARSPDVPQVRVRLAAEHDLVPGTAVRSLIRVPAANFAVRPQPVSNEGPSADRSCLAVPETAVVDHGDRQLVFVESMPGTFDAVVVQLGPRCGDYFPVLSGLQPKQRVAVAGAFLIDAETRLNPSLAVAYFGATQASAEGRAPEVRVASRQSAGSPALTPEEASLAEKQKVCPVTDLPLNSMGGPVISLIEGRKVFLCCKGCEPKLLADPATFLAKLPPP
jgi:Cu(I)/Ag(I) efflux system membrane fusion protein